MWRIAVVACVSCGGKDAPLGPTDQSGLSATLDMLAAMGEKQAGTPGGRMAGDYIEGRFQQLGLADVHRETFQFPHWELASKHLTITIDGVASSPGFDVFEASGSGTADAAIVDVGTATTGELAALDLTGKIALVTRDPSFHRTIQLTNVTAKGAAAMLYRSTAPDNLRQVGTVRHEWQAGTIPAITIGADDGALIKDALTANRTVRAQLDVTASISSGTGTNIVGQIAGDVPDTIVIGAHYDTWFAGSSDNGSGVAELLALAERRLQRRRPHYTLVFVAYDGEEIGLYGGYDFLRKHKIINDEPILAVLNFESPSANDPEIAGLVHTNQPALDKALQAAHLRQLYGIYAGLEVVAQLFGGIIPTDIQGDYRGGIPTVTTAVTNPYYHTSQDTPDKVDLQLLADSTDAFDTAIDNIGELAPADLAVRDHAIWTTDVTTSITGTTLTADATFQNGNDLAAADAVATAVILDDDFTLAATLTATTDASGAAHFEFPAGAATMGSGNRFLHISAGPTYPLVERILALP